MKGKQEASVTEVVAGEDQASHFSSSSQLPVSHLKSGLKYTQLILYLEQILYIEINRVATS